MMTANQHSHFDRLAAALPPEVYFSVATQILNIARNLFRSGFLHGAGLSGALICANRLSRVGIMSWRVRQRWRVR